MSSRAPQRAQSPARSFQDPAARVGLDVGELFCMEPASRCWSFARQCQDGPIPSEPKLLLPKTGENVPNSDLNHGSGDVFYPVKDSLQSPIGMIRSNSPSWC